MMRTAFASLLFALLVACGGGATPAPASAPGNAGGEEALPSADAETCCCDYVTEFGSEEDGTWSEEQTYEMLTPADCADRSGSCIDDPTCGDGEYIPE